MRRGFAAAIWAPDGRGFAYAEERKLWSYAVPGGAKKELVALADLEKVAIKVPQPELFGWVNRGVSEKAVQWTPSGREILISASGDLFLLHLDTGKWDQLTSTAVAENDPKISPDGKRVAFRRGHDLYSLEIEGRKLTRLTTGGTATLLNAELDWVYPEELALETAYWWSPDSTRIAYLQFDVSREPVFPQVDMLKGRLEPQRYPKAGTPNADVRLGVVAVAGGPTRWMDLGDTRDYLLARVNWLPDGKSLAAQRLNRVQNRLDLLLADPATGAARLLVREQDPHWVNLHDCLRFLADGKHFLWASERSGYRHLYLYGMDGKEKKQLTRGEWEVTDLAGLDEARRTVYFVSTQRSPLDRDLYEVGLDSKHLRRLTPEAGTHTVSMNPQCDYYLDTFSSLTAPMGRTLNARDGKQVAVLAEPNRKTAEEYEILPTEIVKFRNSGGVELYARLIKPAGFAPGKKYPVIVMVYGGPHAQSVRNSWSALTWDQALAHRGFVIWQVDNRGSSGRGHVFEIPVFRNLGQKELEDQKDGLRHLASLGFADMERVGIYGWSYGGYMTLYSVANAPELFRAGIAGAPVTDWRNYDSIYTERYMGLPEENEAGYKQSSPQTKAADVRARLMLVHNLQDDNVHFQNTVQMADSLQRAGKQFVMEIYPQKAHGVMGPVRRQMLETLTRFFEENLKP